MSAVVEYISGVCRNDPEKSRAHLYAKTIAGRFWPMCDYGWNRSNGHAFSILRGWSSPHGLCKICQKRSDAGLLPILHAREHKTKWL